MAINIETIAKIRFKHNRQQLEPIKQRWLRRSKEGPYVQGQILIQHLA